MSAPPVDAAAMASATASHSSAGDTAVYAAGVRSPPRDGIRSTRSSNIPLNQLQDHHEILEHDLRKLLTININDFEDDFDTLKLHVRKVEKALKGQYLIFFMTAD